MGIEYFLLVGFLIILTYVMIKTSLISGSWCYTSRFVKGIILAVIIMTYALIFGSPSGEFIIFVGLLVWFSDGIYFIYNQLKNKKNKR